MKYILIILLLLISFPHAQDTLSILGAKYPQDTSVIKILNENKRDSIHNIYWANPIRATTVILIDDSVKIWRKMRGELHKRIGQNKEAYAIDTTLTDSSWIINEYWGSRYESTYDSTIIFTRGAVFKFNDTMAVYTTYVFASLFDRGLREKVIKEFHKWILPSRDTSIVTLVPLLPITKLPAIQIIKFLGYDLKGRRYVK